MPSPPTSADKPLARRRAEALRLLRAGRPVEAEQAFAAILLADSDDAAALHGLGLARNGQGRAEAALEPLRRALVHQPGEAALHNDLGAALHALGRLDEAAGHFALAAELRPDFAVAHNNLGSVLLARGEAAAAARAFERAVALAPNSADLQYNLGNALGVLGDAEPAIERLRRAIRLNPRHLGALVNLGAALVALGRPAEAVEVLRRALALKPDHVGANGNLGVALQALGESEAARSAFGKVVAAQPDNAAGLANLGNVLLELGELVSAERCLARATILAPRQPAYWRALGQLRRFAADGPELAALQALAAAPEGLDGDQRADLHFALAKALDESGRMEESFDHLLDANRLVRAQLAYDEAAALAELAAIAAAPVAPGDGGGAGAEIVLVFGMPRSGTSLVEQILASHPAVVGAGELPDLDRAAAAAGFPASANPDALDRLGRAYLARLRGLAPKAARIVDKTPANFRFAGLIAQVLPEARMIHVRRRPLDTCLSCFATRFAAGQAFTYDLAELGRFWRAYAELMDHWRRVLPAGRMIEVDYESLVAEPEGQIRRMLAHCGLDWDAACLDFHRHRRPVRTASAAQVRQPITTASVGRAEAYRARLAPLIAALGED